METAVSVRNLSVTLGQGVKALQDVSLTIPKGTITGLIGPSGAGKTTLIRTITGRLRVPRGTVHVFNKDAGSPYLRSQISYMPQELSIYTDLTVSENLYYFARMLGLNKHQARTAIVDVLALTELSDKQHQIVDTLSGGQKQRASLCVALLGSPQLLVLDEPTAGLDPVLRNKLWQLFNTIAAKKAMTLIISSHAMDEAQRCQNLLLIREGSVIAEGTPKELLKRTGTDTVEQAFLQLAGGTE